MNRYYVEWYDLVENEWGYVEYKFYRDAANAVAALSTNPRFSEVKQGNV